MTFNLFEIYPHQPRSFQSLCRLSAFESDVTTPMDDLPGF